MKVAAPIDKMPIFIKAGSIIPMQPIMNYTDEHPIDTMFLGIYPSIQENGQFTLYEDDGKTLEYQTGSFAQTTFRQSFTGPFLSIDIDASIGTYTGKPTRRTYISDIHNVLLENGQILLNDQALLQRNNFQDMRQTGDGYFYDSLKGRLYIQTITDSDSNYKLVINNIEITNVDNSDEPLPDKFILEQNYPNPFNPVTTIKYALPTESRVLIRIFNMLGQVIGTITDCVQGPGSKSVKWNADYLSSGVYFLRFEATNVSNPAKTFAQVRKLILMK
jgi:hypothetical protein